MFAFFLLIGPLIFVHELGHLIAAKLVDVKVERFSLGFGPTLLSRRIGETEYVLAPIPLGGYVSMLGQRPGEELPAADADRAVSSKPLWARFFVLGAGPLANLILPIFVYFFFFVVNHTMVTPPIIGTVTPHSAAEAAGLEQGDRVVSIEGRDIHSWEEMRNVVTATPGEELRLQIDRNGKRLDRIVTPQKVVIRNTMGVAESRGRLGVLSISYAPQIGIIDPTAPAYTAGLRTGDVMTSINGEPVRTSEELTHALARQGKRDAVVRLTYLRPTNHVTSLATFLVYESHHAQLLPRKTEDGTRETGLLPGQTFIRSVDPGSPAAEAGLRAGDRILEVDDKPFSQPILLDEAFGRKRDQPVNLRVQSPGQEPRHLDVVLTTRTWKDIYNQTRTQPWFGAQFFQKHTQAPPEPLRGRFTYSLSAAFDQTYEAATTTWTALVQMVRFERGVEELSSVVGIYQVAGTAYERGPGEFLLLLAILSVNLGIFNLLPIPVLDGGHMLFFTIEAVRRRPMSQRAREIVSAIGVFVIVILMFIALRNDILRWWS